ncbi:hypothetical protein [Moorena sp. SIO1F2]|nr:hypothetical protein [Moorena sp. SIO1F2]
MPVLPRCPFHDLLKLARCQFHEFLAYSSSVMPPIKMRNRNKFL